VHSQEKIGEAAPTTFKYGYEGHDPPLRPLVKHHPVTGRRSLFIGRHAYGIPGLADEESQRLLDDLLAFACQPPRVWRHRWQAGDVAIWDNRCVLHRARPFDPVEPRVMHHTRIAGDPATESGL
jgi:alpha-ketoglutarate-dependent taurine dioxygenase